MGEELAALLTFDIYVEDLIPYEIDEFEFGINQAPWVCSESGDLRR